MKYFMWTVAISLILWGCFDFYHIENKRFMMISQMQNELRKIPMALPGASKYILEHDLNKDEHYTRLLIKAPVTAKTDPVYINLNNWLSVPIGGVTIDTHYNVASFYNISLNTINIDKAQVYFTPNYNNRCKYLDRTEAINYMRRKYDVDLTDYRITSNVVAVLEGPECEKIYVYGYRTGDQFVATKISNDLNYLIDNIFRYDYYYLYTIGIMIISFLILC